VAAWVGSVDKTATAMLIHALRLGSGMSAGTGKTLLARAVANRTDACFIRVIGSELVQKYVGEVSC
jgi:MoxR-like ATPase